MRVVLCVFQDSFAYQRDALEQNRMKITLKRIAKTRLYNQDMPQGLKQFYFGLLPRTPYAFPVDLHVKSQVKGLFYPLNVKQKRNQATLPVCTIHRVGGATCKFGSFPPRVTSFLYFRRKDPNSLLERFCILFMQSSFQFFSLSSDDRSAKDFSTDFSSAAPKMLQKTLCHSSKSSAMLPVVANSHTHIDSCRRAKGAERRRNFEAT